MNILNQKKNSTSYNRYPNIFKEISCMLTEPLKILSFGCSSGEECISLSDIYFKRSNITGFDINKEIIAKNIINNKISNINYIYDLKKLDTNFDLIFAMSVLCKWPENMGKYTFKNFEYTLSLIDKLLNKNGYLCIYNSKYLFTDTDIFKNKYEIIPLKHKDSGFVTKYTSKNNLVKNYDFILFRKID